MTKRSFFALSLLIVLCGVAVAQPGDANKAASKTAASNSKPAKDAKDPEAERFVKERRDNAQSLLISWAADAGRFNDQMLRARTQARIADVLWSADAERAKALFRKAWDSAEIIDQESQRKQQEDIKQQQARSNGNGIAIIPAPNVRGEVLRLAAKHDRALGEEFLGKMTLQQAQDATAAADRQRNDPLGA